MAFVVTDACIRCKYMDCVEICPAECFHEGENMVVINPGGCIDCNLCAPECPADAILSDMASEAGDWLELNATYSAIWPNITQRGEPPQDADQHRGEKGKYDRYFSAEQGAGA